MIYEEEEEKELLELIAKMHEDTTPSGTGENGIYTDQDYADVIRLWREENVHPEVVEEHYFWKDTERIEGEYMEKYNMSRRDYILSQGGIEKDDGSGNLEYNKFKHTDTQIEEEWNIMDYAMDSFDKNVHVSESLIRGIKVPAETLFGEDDMEFAKNTVGKYGLVSHTTLVSDKGTISVRTDELDLDFDKVNDYTYTDVDGTKYRVYEKTHKFESILNEWDQDILDAQKKADLDKINAKSTLIQNNPEINIVLDEVKIIEHNGSISEVIQTNWKNKVTQTIANNNKGILTEQQDNYIPYLVEPKFIAGFDSYNIGAYYLEAPVTPNGNLTPNKYSANDVTLAAGWENVKNNIYSDNKEKIDFDVSAYIFGVKSNVTHETEEHGAWEKTYDANSFSWNANTNSVLGGFEKSVNLNWDLWNEKMEQHQLISGEEVPPGFEDFYGEKEYYVLKDNKITREKGQVIGDLFYPPKNAIEANNSHYHILFKNDFKKDLIRFFKGKYNLDDKGAKKMYDLYYKFLDGKSVREDLENILSSTGISLSGEAENHFTKHADRVEQAYIEMAHREYNEKLNPEQIKRYMSLTTGLHIGFSTLDGHFGSIHVGEVTLKGEKVEDHDLPYLQPFFEKSIEDGEVVVKKDTNFLKDTDEEAMEQLLEELYGDYNFKFKQVKPGFDIVRITAPGGSTFDLYCGGKGWYGGFNDLSSSRQDKHFDAFIKFMRKHMSKVEWWGDFQKDVERLNAEYESEYKQHMALSPEQQKVVDAIDVDDLYETEGRYIQPREATEDQFRVDEFGIEYTIPGVEGHSGYYVMKEAKYPDAIKQATNYINAEIEKGTIPPMTTEKKNELIENIALSIAKHEERSKLYKKNMDKSDDDGFDSDLMAAKGNVAENYHMDLYVKKHKIVFHKNNQLADIIKRVNEMNVIYNDPTQKFSIIPGEEVGILPDGREIPLRLLEIYMQDIAEGEAVQKEIKTLQEEMNDVQMKISEEILYQYRLWFYRYIYRYNSVFNWIHRSRYV